MKNRIRTIQWFAGKSLSVFSLLVSLALALGFIWGLVNLLSGQTVLVSAAPVSTSAATSALAEITVCLDGPPTCDYGTIQAAVDAANPGDVIKVAAGAYIGVQGRPAPPGYAGPSIIAQAVYISKTVTIRGGYTTAFSDPPDPEANPTTLDAQGLGRVLFITGNPSAGSGQGISPTIEGLRITGGDATGLGGYTNQWGNTRNAGGGVYITTATATISNTWALSNTAEYGGGVYLAQSPAVLSGNTIVSNSDTDYQYDGGGGGVYLFNSDATLSSNIISNNYIVSGNGGGLCLEGSAATFSGNAISNNTAVLGGGLSLRNSDATLVDNTVSGNTSTGYPDGGGGLYLHESLATLSNNAIVSNTANGYGGGLSLWSSGIVIRGNTIASNIAGDGGGVYLKDSPATLSDNTIAANTADGSIGGGGVYLENSDAMFSSNTIISNTAEGAFGGGGVYLAGNVTLISNTISNNNTSRWGGGLFMGGGNTTLEGNIISANFAEEGGGLFGGGGVISGNIFFSNTASSSGGGLSLWGDTMFNRNTVSNNTALVGGGLAVYEGDATLSGNTISNNTADHVGGVFLYKSDAALVNNVIADNRINLIGIGSGLLVAGSSPRLLHNTIAGNTGGDGSGIYVYESSSSTIALTNTILVSHTVGISVAAGNTVTVNGVLWDSTPITVSQSPTASVVVQGEYWGDPAFVDTEGGNYHIGPGSAAIDRGVNAGVATDVDGDSRPMGLGYDLGADEYAGVGLEVIKRPSAALVNRGQVLTYTIFVANAGMENVTGVVLTDTLDSWQQPLNATSSIGGCSIADDSWGGAVVCTPGRMVTGTTVVITLTAQISTSVTIGQALTNAVVAVANETANSAQVTNIIHDCHARINDDPAEYIAVQAAVDAANPGDVVKVAGYCLGVNERGRLRQQVYLDKSLTIRGGYTPAFTGPPDPVANPTTLDAQGQGRVLYIAAPAPSAGDLSALDVPSVSGQSITPTIEGLRLTGGDATGLSARWGENAGGGVYVINAAVTLSRTWVFSNTAAVGGGLYLYRSAAIIRGNTINGNTADKWGNGGGLYLYDSDVSFNGNTIVSNSAGWGGGLCMSNDSDATLINNIIADNQAGVVGSGLHISGYSRLLHTTIARNQGGDGSGIYVVGTVVLTNTILVSQAVGINVAAYGSMATLDGVLWFGNGANTGGAGTVAITQAYTGDPAFVNADRSGRGDYHIGPASTAIDRGVNVEVTTDIDGEPRPVGDGCDLGADEYLPTPALAVTKKGVPDSVQPGGRLTYTVRLTNTGNVALHATITDVLPVQVMTGTTPGGTAFSPGGTVTWQGVTIMPSDVWADSFAVTVAVGYAGPLVNVVQVTTEEGATGAHSETVTVETRKHYIYLPVILKQ